jgi:glycosyltransferase involved in cell wall biosynthesis
MRYLWDFYQDYLESFGPVTRTVFKLFAHRLRLWDYASAARVDRFIANSRWVAGRIRKYYRREAKVIYPPVDCARFRPADGVFTPPPADAPYVILGQLVAYKKVDLAINAFNASGRKLLIIGDGEQRKKLQAAAGPNIRFALRRDDTETARLLAGSRALVFPGEEDFGIVPLEAAAAGRPVLAYARGGALETVRDGVTGLFFAEQTPESLNAGLDRLEAMYSAFDPATLSAWAANFDAEVFDRRMREYLELACNHGLHCVRDERPTSLGGVKTGDTRE